MAVKMTKDFFEWTDAQWDAYNSEVVEIPLHRLETFCTAVGLLANGSRLNKEERLTWERLLNGVYQPLYNEAVKKALDKAGK